MNGERAERMRGLRDDLRFSLVTFVVLAMILGAVAALFRLTLQPIVGQFCAGTWWITASGGYCLWQFYTLRRLRRTEQTPTNRPRGLNVARLMLWITYAAVLFAYVGIAEHDRRSEFAADLASYGGKRLTRSQAETQAGRPLPNLPDQEFVDEGN